jgi:hypothetical protein
MTGSAAAVLNGRIAAAAPGSQGFDTDTVVTTATAHALYATGFRFGIRYISRTVPQHTGDLSTSEAMTILSAGLALMPVQHCDRQGWSPSAILGTAYGIGAAGNAAEIGFPVGVNIWLDLEGPLISAAPEQVIAFVNAWSDAVAVGGFVPGLYVGFDELLTSDQLYHRLKLRHYWRSASQVPDVSLRGYQIIKWLVNSGVRP